MLKVSMALCLFFVNSNLSAAENEGAQPNRAGIAGQQLMNTVAALKEREKEETKTGWAPPKEQYVVTRAGTVTIKHSHRPEKDPHEGHTVKGLPNPYSGKKH